MDHSVKPQPEADPCEPAADAIIEACGGDPREAVIALLGERDHLLGRIEALEESISWGFLRAGPRHQAFTE